MCDSWPESGSSTSLAVAPGPGAGELVARRRFGAAASRAWRSRTPAPGRPRPGARAAPDARRAPPPTSAETGLPGQPEDERPPADAERERLARLHRDAPEDLLDAELGAGSAHEVVRADRHAAGADEHVRLEAALERLADARPRRPRPGRSAPPRRRRPRTRPRAWARSTRRSAPAPSGSPGARSSVPGAEHGGRSAAGRPAPRRRRRRRARRSGPRRAACRREQEVAARTSPPAGRTLAPGRPAPESPSRCQIRQQARSGRPRPHRPGRRRRWRSPSPRRPPAPARPAGRPRSGRRRAAGPACRRPAPRSRPSRSSRTAAGRRAA